MKEVEKKIADGRVLSLIHRYLKQDVLEATPSYAADERKGTPQGAVISPLLANIYLYPVGMAMGEEGYEMVRYADDCVVLCGTQEEAERALARLRELMTARELTLHPRENKACRCSPVPGGFDFSGITSSRETLSAQEGETSSKTKSASDATSQRIRVEGDHLKTQRGAPWVVGYFKHSRHGVFKPLDGWIRRRVRSILRTPSRTTRYRTWKRLSALA